MEPSDCNENLTKLCQPESAHFRSPTLNINGLAQPLMGATLENSERDLGWKAEMDPE